LAPKKGRPSPPDRGRITAENCANSKRLRPPADVSAGGRRPMPHSRKKTGGGSGRKIHFNNGGATSPYCAHRRLSCYKSPTAGGRARRWISISLPSRKPFARSCGSGLRSICHPTCAPTPRAASRLRTARYLSAGECFKRSFTRRVGLESGGRASTADAAPDSSNSTSTTASTSTRARRFHTTTPQSTSGVRP
jgi:hypothetical protein